MQGYQCTGAGGGMKMQKCILKNIRENRAIKFRAMLPLFSLVPRIKKKHLIKCKFSPV